MHREFESVEKGIEECIAAIILKFSYARANVIHSKVTIFSFKNMFFHKRFMYQTHKQTSNHLWFLQI